MVFDMTFETCGEAVDRARDQAWRLTLGRRQVVGIEVRIPEGEKYIISVAVRLAIMHDVM